MGMQMRTVVVAARFVARYSTRVGGDSSQIELDELEEIPVERGLVPVLVANSCDNLCMG
jgi:hypothetical protein